MPDDGILEGQHQIGLGPADDWDVGSVYRSSKAENGVTIFIPNWNHRPYLPRSIRSALQASDYLERANFSAEVLIIDDASRDGSQKLLRTLQARYGGPRLRTGFLEQNLGLPKLRNLALRMSRFRYVCLMDADNELVPANLPLFLQSILDTNAALIHGNLIVRSTGGEVKQLHSNQVATTRLFQKNYIDAFALVDACKLLRAGGFTNALRRHGYEDWEMILHLIAEEERIVFVPAVMGYYYRHHKSMLQSVSAHAEETKGLLQRMYAQGGTREWDPIRLGRVYHPAVGFID